MEYELQRPYKTFGKSGFKIQLPDFPVSDGVGNAIRSRLYFFEDGKQIGEAHQGIGLIGAYGKGRFSHWDQALYFSTSDGSNANDNGRRYSVMWSNELYFKERSSYFHSVLENTLANVGMKPSDLRGKNVLEIGCGRQHGMSLVMAGYGANVVAVDRYAPTWDEELHPEFMEYLIHHAPTLWSGFEGERLQPLLSQRSFLCDPLTFYPNHAEMLDSYTQVKFDVQISIAALEHFYDLNRVASALFRTAKTGCVGCHLLDARDHREFARPLEFLLLSDSEYDALSGNEKYVHGNRWRPKDMQRLWLSHGFVDLKEKTNDYVDDEYFNDFLPRLRASGTRFSDECEDTLRRLSIVYTMRKPSSSKD